MYQSQLNLIQTEIAIKTIYNAPVVGVGGICIDSFIIEGHTSRLRILFQKIITSSVAEELCEETFSSNGVPVAATHFAAENSRSGLNSIDHCL